MKFAIPLILLIPVLPGCEDLLGQMGNQATAAMYLLDDRSPSMRKSALSGEFLADAFGPAIDRIPEKDPGSVVAACHLESLSLQTPAA